MARAPSITIWDYGLCTDPRSCTNNGTRHYSPNSLSHSAAQRVPPTTSAYAIFSSFAVLDCPFSTGPDETLHLIQVITKLVSITKHRFLIFHRQGTSRPGRSIFAGSFCQLSGRRHQLEGNLVVIGLRLVEYRTACQTIATGRENTS